MIKAESWRPADGLVLEPNALAAATEMTRSLALTAGPGAGKSEMLAQRADFLLRTGACYYPQRILAISFKVDAAKNLRDRVRKRCGPPLAARFDSYTFHGFAKRIIDRFRPVLVGQNALNSDYTVGDVRYQHSQITFQDMVPLALEILEKSDVARNAVRQTYSHVFLDEFQDCTGAQYQLVRAAFHGTGIQLTAVGDTKQRIMGWAGALEGIFTYFASDFSAQSLNLYQNYRSQPRIRRVQNAMVKVMDPAASVPAAQIAGEDGDVEVLAYPDCQAEAEDIAGKIEAAILVCGVQPSEIAILVSKQPELYTQKIMAELDKRGIPFRNEQQLQDLSAEPAARLIVDLLAVVYGESEPDAYARLMGVLMATDFSDDDTDEGRARWYRLIDDLRKKGHESAASGVTAETLKQTAITFLKVLGVEALMGLSADYESESRLKEVVQQTFERIAELMGTSPDHRKALARFGEDGAVRIMTIHKSKGLEFDTVAIFGVENETFWGKPDDERAAFFVGISRAKCRLWLTHVSRRARPSGKVKYWNEARTLQKEFIGYALGALK
ncbi:MAG TPA: ATP-dependent helicase [Steroidobacteraceae bacterium]|nr:ATP-dependent helicase [Steroidobacteraceae bacterium]